MRELRASSPYFGQQSFPIPAIPAPAPQWFRVWEWRSNPWGGGSPQWIELGWHYAGWMTERWVFDWVNCQRREPGDRIAILDANGETFFSLTC